MFFEKALNKSLKGIDDSVSWEIITFFFIFLVIGAGVGIWGGSEASAPGKMIMFGFLPKIADLFIVYLVFLLVSVIKRGKHLFAFYFDAALGAVIGFCSFYFSTIGFLKLLSLF